MPKTLQQCKTARDFETYARKHGAEIQEGGSHTLIVTSKGKCAIPRHKGDIATGTRFSIIKTFILLGLGMLAIAFVLYSAGLFV